MKRFCKRFMFAVVLFLGLAGMSLSNAYCFDPVSIIASSIVSTGLNKGIDWLLTPSKTAREYEQRHEHFQFLAKAEFILEIKALRTIAGASYRKILNNHELYRYPSFIEAIKEGCPSYATYIKELLVTITHYYHGRRVRGFKIERRGNILHRHLRDIREYDHYEFYELVKKLHDEIVEQEASLRQEEAYKLALANELIMVLNEQQSEDGRLPDCCLPKDVCTEEVALHKATDVKETNREQGQF